MSYLKHSPRVKLDWKPLLKEITSGAEFCFYSQHKEPKGSEGGLVAMPTAEAVSLAQKPRGAQKARDERLSLLTPVWTVKAIFHLSRYKGLAARQLPVILFSGTRGDGVERPRGDGAVQIQELLGGTHNGRVLL